MRRSPFSFFQDLHAAAFTAGFVAVLVGFTSSVAIVFQAAQAFHATPAQLASWIWALGLGMGLISTPATESILLVLPPARCATAAGALLGVPPTEEGSAGVGAGEAFTGRLTTPRQRSWARRQRTTR